MSEIQVYETNKNYNLIFQNNLQILKKITEDMKISLKKLEKFRKEEKIIEKINRNTTKIDIKMKIKLEGDFKK